MHRILFILTFPLLVLTACKSDEAFSDYQRTEADFRNKLNGEVSPLQTWRTAVELKVQLTASLPTHIWLMAAPAEATLYDYCRLDKSGTVAMTAPQGLGNTVYLVCKSGKQWLTKAVTLTGRTTETVHIDMAEASTAQAAAQAFEPRRSDVAGSADRTSLYGNSVKGDAHHLQFSSQQIRQLDNIKETVMNEGINAAKIKGLNCDYELGSNGPFYITWLTGCCLSNSAHVLGYYYHSPGTYDDIVYVDIAETELYDYIDGLAKVQYKVDAATAAANGLEPDRWYDANFDIYDTFDTTPNVEARRGDDAYNMQAVLKKYRNGITAIRGVSFLINVPQGKHIGFYDREEKTPAPEQYDRLVRHGIKPYTTRDKFKGTSYSAQGMNIYNSEGQHRSFISQQQGIFWMGMENQVLGGDLDCNDVMFGVTVDLDVYTPSVQEPDLQSRAEYTDIMPWTMAFDDVYRHADFDFNDAVIRLMPDYNNETCCVSLLAVGTAGRMYLHYDGPDGDINLGELHELFGVSADLTVNTATTVAATPFVSLPCVKWPADYTMTADARRFYIEVQRGSCTDCTDILALSAEPGKMPEALLVAGDWCWPTEATPVTTAYNIFALWAKDATKTNYWNWHRQPVTGKYVSY